MVLNRDEVCSAEGSDCFAFDGVPGEVFAVGVVGVLAGFGFGEGAFGDQAFEEGDAVAEVARLVDGAVQGLVAVPFLDRRVECD